MRNFTVMLAGVMLALASPIPLQKAHAEEAPASPEHDKLMKAITYSKQGMAALASEELDAVIAAQEAKEASEKRKIYCSRSQRETVAYMLTAASDNIAAVAYDADCSLSLYMKAYVLIDLRRSDEARAFLDRALARSPMNAQYLGELAEWHKARREWPEALAAFKRADEATSLSPDYAKTFEQGRAWRGIGFVLIEQGKLDEAETWFKKCLKLNPDDKGAKGELDYIKSLRAKT